MLETTHTRAQPFDANGHRQVSVEVEEPTAATTKQGNRNHECKL